VSHKSIISATHVGTEVAREEALPLLLSRIMLKIRITESGCWEWTGYKTRLGYASATFQGKAWRVHRFMYQALTNKPIDDGFEICHSCHNRACLNPYHIRQDTHQANLMDSSRARRLQGQIKTHCLRGHPLSGDNLSNGVFRQCNICSRARYRRRLGWPEHMLYTEVIVPAGYGLNRKTGEIVPAKDVSK
jgi:HNH endonuclease